MHGFGRYFHADKSGLSYEGYWQNDKPHGLGIEKNENHHAY